MLTLASFDGNSVASFIVALCEVYIGLILLYVLISMALNFGLRPPYTRAFDVLMTFLREVCEPYLGIFRKLISPIGMIDLSPILAIICLGIIDRVAVQIFGA